MGEKQVRGNRMSMSRRVSSEPIATEQTVVEKAVGLRRATLTVAVVLCYIGLFTVSWDRLGNLSVGAFNVKISVVAFGLSLVLAAIATLSGRKFYPPKSILALMSGIVLVMIVSSAFSLDVRAAVLSTLTVIAGAMVPALAVYAAASLGRFEHLLKWFVWGALFACLFGLYQLVAFYLDLPQFIEYEGQSGGLGRIASFSYEPAYLGYFLVLALAAACVRVYLTGGTWARYAHLLLIVATLVLLNSRAVFLTIPLLLVLSWPVLRRFISTKQVLICASSALGLFIVVCFAIPAIPTTLWNQFLSIFNPNEVTSNAPRLQIYGAAVDIARDHPWFGVGPSNFGLYIQGLQYQQYDGVSLNKMVTNNIWLQAMMDGGVFLLLIQLALAIYVIVKVYFSGNNSARLLASGWLSVVVVGGMVVSNFYDAKLWVFLALALVAVRIGAERPTQSLGAPTRDDPALP
ncbi:O-antigen ligase [Cryobacterium sp. PAMC25264]|uniref:O-antigen ligase family protein n=1 Tax=Cryobacterium sp. PAMC25264 TaxID=2861288 RepID=UPI001C62BC7E|nr:O-antigen ligase family protein [Cryobacterium sp. PAMC25264]QYF72665.1 O-antigen ligase family protein [Cryobacterium sp. PAMC25264]